MGDYSTIKEGRATIKAPEQKVVSSDMPVFYNPVMKFNRDVSVILFNVWDRSDLKVALPLAGTGIRGIRLLLEANNIEKVFFNDAKEDAVGLIKKNLEDNDIKDLFEISQHEASRFLFNNKPFDYIDIDPFGTPNPFLDAATKKLALKGILAVTATDTSSLCGAYTNACRRKYWATPNNDFMMHETGLRILIRKVQLVGMQWDRALTPVLSYSKDHYVRVFFRCRKSKNGCNDILKQHGMLGDAGPLWLGPLQDNDILEKMVDFLKTHSDYVDAKQFIELLHEESKEPFNSIPGFVDIHAASKRLKLKAVPKLQDIMDKIKETNKVTRTHFSKYGIKTDMEKEELDKLLQSF